MPYSSLTESEGTTLPFFLLLEASSCSPLGGSLKNLPLRISFKIIPVCIFLRAKLQDKLHSLLHAIFLILKRNISPKKFNETFALLDKSVYHIFGEDCACGVNQTGSAPEKHPIRQPIFTGSSIFPPRAAASR